MGISVCEHVQVFLRLEVNHVHGLAAGGAVADVGIRGSA
jgi:hypothetical protein